MPGIQFIQHQGRRVLLFDFTGVAETEEALRLMAQARAVVAAQPRRKELLIAVDVKGMTTNDTMLEAFRNLARHNAPWVLASAICSPSRLGRVITRANGVITGRTFEMFDDRQKGLDWLVTQDATASPQGGAASAGSSSSPDSVERPD